MIDQLRDRIDMEEEKWPIDMAEYGTITGSVDGLMIIDSFGQESLAQRIGQTEGWQEFTLYRIAPHSGHLSVTFALTGLGEARIDDVTIESVEPAR